MCASVNVVPVCVCVTSVMNGARTRAYGRTHARTPRARANTHTHTPTHPLTHPHTHPPAGLGDVDAWDDDAIVQAFETALKTTTPVCVCVCLC